MRSLAVLGAMLAACLTKPDPPSTGTGSGVIEYVDSFVGEQLPSSVTTFEARAAHAGDAIVLMVGCPDAVSTFEVSAPGWALSSLTTPIGATGPAAASFGAIAPDTRIATFTVAAAPCTAVTLLGDEFANADPTMPFDSFRPAAGNGACAVDVATASANEAVWASCLVSSIATAAAPYTMGATDNLGDCTEYKITTDPDATPELAQFSGFGQFAAIAVAIRPR